MANLPTAVLGRTGLEVTRLGYGAMELRSNDGDRAVSGEHSNRVLNAVLDAGINFIDTAVCYGLSEERIGKAISHRRDEFFIATKCGCPATPSALEAGGNDYGRENMEAGVDQSLRRMKTDHLDVLQFHGLLQNRSLRSTTPSKRCSTSGTRGRSGSLLRHPLCRIFVTISKWACSTRSKSPTLP